MRTTKLMTVILERAHARTEDAEKQTSCEPQENGKKRQKPRLTFEELKARKFCGARTRAGTPCKRRDLYWSGRCRLHGGLSTGPKTEEGKARSALNGFRPKKQSPCEVDKS